MTKIPVNTKSTPAVDGRAVQQLQDWLLREHKLLSDLFFNEDLLAACRAMVAAYRRGRQTARASRKQAPTC